MSNQPSIACDPNAINKKERTEHNRNAEYVLASVTRIQELNDGYALQLPLSTDMIRNAAAFIALERLCCPFFHFSLEVEPNQGGLWMQLIGDEKVKQYLADNLIPKIQTDNTG